MATIAEALTLALQHHQAGQLDTAEQIYRQILAAVPQQAEALDLLGVVLFQKGQHPQALELIQQAIARKEQVAEFHCHLGQVLHALQHYDAALAAHQRAVQLKPTLAEAHVNLGITHKVLGQFAAAETAYLRAIDANPQLVEAHNNLGLLRKQLGQLQLAMNGFRRALELKPDHVSAHLNLGLTHFDLKQYDAAIACFRRALELQPHCAEAYNNLGITLHGQLKLDDAAECYRRAIELNPLNPEAFSNLGNVLKDQGQLDEAITAYRRSLELKPDYVDVHDNLLVTLQYHPQTTLATLRAELDAYDRQHASRFRSHWREFANDRDTERRLNIGFVSADFGRHPVGHLVRPVLAHLDRAECATFCYSHRVAQDDLTFTLKQSSDQWRDIAGWNDERLAEQIRADAIDVLVDLSGHTAYNRLLTFARKPAPVQVSWLGGVGPAGISAIDYFLADHALVPDDLLGHYRERVMRLPVVWSCQLPVNAPDVGPLPATSRGYVTFASCNNIAKTTPEIVHTWAEILRQVPTARLLLKYRGLLNPSVSARFRALFAAEGIEPERLELQDESSFAEMLDIYNTQVDVALDTFPFNGGMTTTVAVYMGVPVVTWPGETVAARQSLSVLSALGVSETVARDRAEYVALAVELARDVPRLARLRAGLRPRCVASPLYDGPTFVREFMQQVRGMWRAWVNEQRAAKI